MARGLNFSIPPGKLDYVDFLVSFELLHRKVCNGTIAPESKMDKDFVKTRLKNIALSGLRKNLKNDHSIFVMKPDKANGIVTLNRDDHCSKMETKQFIQLHMYTTEVKQVR